MIIFGSRKNIYGCKSSSVSLKGGFSTLEKILIPAGAILLCACIVFGALWLNGRKSSEGAVITAPSLTTSSATQIETKDSSKTTVASETAATNATASATQGATAATNATAATAATTTAATAAASISNPASMYSSYANLVSFDPATGLAQFDYFDLLKGADAVKYLVEEKGYTKAAAQAEVDGYADSEFINKNENPQLRTADMKAVTIMMLYGPDGAQTTSWPDTDSMTFSAFKSFYAAHPEQVLTKSSFFYYVTVVNSVITKVEQVYWA